MIAIHDTQNGFSRRWIAYCEEEGIPFKIVDCYATDIIDQLADCDALMWQYNQAYPADKLIGTQLFNALHHAGFVTFPDFASGWHFDDKVAQKYLLEKLGIAMARADVFFTKAEALAWIATQEFPKVFKLRGGAGAKNVQLVPTRERAVQLVNKAFGRGFRPIDRWALFKDVWQKYRHGLAGMRQVLKAAAHLAYPYRLERAMGREKGYVYFQEFIPDNDHDIRTYVIDGKAFAIYRGVREGDFRASGSGFVEYGRAWIDERLIELSFRYAALLQSGCVTFDYVFRDGEPLVLEISYGFMIDACDPIPGYWTPDLQWHPGRFDAGRWMVDFVRKRVAAQKTSA